MFHPDGPSFRELMIQALSSTEKGYDLIAKKFDHTPFRTPDPVIVAMAKVIGEPGSIGSALDICCGTGASMMRLRALCKDRVVGLERQQPMHGRALRQQGLLERGLGHGERVVVLLDEVDVLAAGHQPVALVVRRPDDVRTFLQPAPGQVDVVATAGRIEDVEIDDQIGRHVVRARRECFGMHVGQFHLTCTASAPRRV